MIIRILVIYWLLIIRVASVSTGRFSAFVNSYMGNTVYNSFLWKHTDSFQGNACSVSKLCCSQEVWSLKSSNAVYDSLDFKDWPGMLVNVFVYTFHVSHVVKKHLSDLLRCKHCFDGNACSVSKLCYSQEV